MWCPRYSRGARGALQISVAPHQLVPKKCAASRPVLSISFCTSGIPFHGALHAHWTSSFSPCCTNPDAELGCGLRTRNQGAKGRCRIKLGKLDAESRHAIPACSLDAKTRRGKRIRNPGAELGHVTLLWDFGLKIRTQNSDLKLGRRIRLRNLDAKSRQRTWMQSFLAKFGHGIRTRNWEAAFGRIPLVDAACKFWVQIPHSNSVWIFRLWIPHHVSLSALCVQILWLDSVVGCCVRIPHQDSMSKLHTPCTSSAPTLGGGVPH